MGLPQEVVDRIMDILQDDMKDLKACSLTCKAMFASTRHLIHQTLHVTREINQKILTPEEKRRYSRGDYRELELRILSFMGERDLLKYVRHVNIRMELMFSPNVLGPHLQHFRSLDRVHTLTIHSFDALLWHEVHNTYFAQFYPTLTTLALIFPIDDYRFMPRFALQFPNLENLTIESLQPQIWPGTYSAITQSPPLRGHFRCVGVGQRDPGWLRELAFDLPNGINFRSVEFQDVHWEHGQHILDGCASSLEEFMFTVNVDRDGKELPPLYFRARLNAPIHISRILQAGPPPIPGEQLTPIRRAPHPILQLVRTVDGTRLDQSFDHHISRSLRIRARASWAAV